MLSCLRDQILILLTDVELRIRHVLVVNLGRVILITWFNHMPDLELLRVAFLWIAESIINLGAEVSLWKLPLQLVCRSLKLPSVGIGMTIKVFVKGVGANVGVFESEGCILVPCLVTHQKAGAYCGTFDIDIVVGNLEVRLVDKTHCSHGTLRIPLNHFFILLKLERW